MKIGQSEILQFLKRNKNHVFSLKELAMGMGESKPKIGILLKRLIKHKEVNYKEISRTDALIRYGCKKRMKVYYV